jgi:dTDP-4-dehydrorhamnose reductase
MKILVAGGAGQVGRALRELPAQHGIYLDFAERDQLDVTNNRHIDQALDNFQPNVVINATAYTDVDGAEGDAETAYAVNRDGPAMLAAACDVRGTVFIHLSTDFVFDGKANRPYREEDPVNPLSIYGKSKAEGERAIVERLEKHVIVRTSWVFSPYRKNFVKSILRLAMEKSELRVVHDQVGGPTAASDIATTLIKIASAVSDDEKQWGIYHFCGVPALSKYDFATAIVETARPLIKKIPQLVPSISSKNPYLAQRPAFTDLNCNRIYEQFDISQPDWRGPMAKIIKEHQNER